MRYLLLLTLLPALMPAQPAPSALPATRIARKGATLPASCTDGQLFQKSGTTPGPFSCVGTSWVAMGVAGAGTGDVVGPAASIDGEVAVYDSTTGKLLKRLSSTGLGFLTSGVLSTDSGLQFNSSTKSLGVFGPIVSGQTSNYLGKFLLNGITSGTVTIQPANEAGTWTWTLPANDGNAGQPLITNGSGVSSWTSDLSGLNYLSIARIITGTTLTTALTTGATPLSIQTDPSTDYGVVFSAMGANAYGMENLFAKSRSTNGTTATVVQNSDSLGVLKFYGDDGTNYALAASISAVVSGTPADDSVPGKIVLATTPVGGGSPVDRMTIGADGTTTMTGILNAAPGGTTSACQTVTVPYTDAIFQAAAVTADKTLIALPARAKIQGITIKHTVAFEGTAVSSTTVSVGNGSSSYDQYATAFNIFQAVADTTFQDTAQFKSTTMATHNLSARFTANTNFGTGAATVLTAGSVAISACWVVLP